MHMIRIPPDKTATVDYMLHTQEYIYALFIGHEVGIVDGSDEVLRNPGRFVNVRTWVNTTSPTAIQPWYFLNLSPSAVIDHVVSVLIPRLVCVLPT